MSSKTYFCLIQLDDFPCITFEMLIFGIKLFLNFRTLNYIFVNKLMACYKLLLFLMLLYTV
jgi:hypothetical protein